MPTNIEIKARVRDWLGMTQRAAALSDTPEEILEQTDTFFRCPIGRLKLREFLDGHGELIAYSREDIAGTKSSDYRITRTAEPEALRRTLADALGILGVVKKRRHLYLASQTRIHLDEVEGLGRFMELEVVLRPDQAAEEGEQIARDLMVKLGVEPADLLAGAYMDMLAPSGISGS
jgi:adenylate cyclase class IV